jgi:4-alpha-glucanotransferase
MTAIDFYERRAGVLLHPTSLPSSILDTDVERWLELISRAGFSVWQVLPLGEPQSGRSPYTCVSAFAMNPALLGRHTPPDRSSTRFREFCAANHWVEDYATFKLLHRKFNAAAWYEWPEVYKQRHTDVLAAVRREYGTQYLQLLWQQFELHERWLQIRQSANRMGILLFGDMPLFVAHDSADVWANPDRFLLDDQGRVEVVAGVPPDYYSATGQRWGNPHYNWEVMQATNFDWWLQRMDYHLEMFDLVRIDHFRGLEASWVINAACDTAVDGHWEKMPGDELLAAIRAHAGHLPIVAEDLGIITPEVTALRRKYHLPGMSVMQFGFDAFEDNPHKPQNVEPDRVVYTGTHDNDTTRGWFESLDPKTQRHVMGVLGMEEALDGGATAADLADRVVDRLVDSAMNTPASLCMIPFQDVLHLGSAARMNTPGTTNGNWRWSFQWDQLDSKMINTMRQRVELAGRLAKVNV